MIYLIENRPTNNFWSEKASIYPREFIVFDFIVKNSYFFIVIKFLAILPYELQANLAFINHHCSGQFCSNSWLCMSGGPFPIERHEFFLKLFTK